MSQQYPFEGIKPTSIEGDAERKAMKVTWSDGHVSELTYEWLRWHCPCAHCSGEGGAPGTLQSTKELTAEQTSLSDLELVGAYGMTPVWADGHSTGIFTFRNLRAMCPCEMCAGRRKALAAAASD